MKSSRQLIEINPCEYENKDELLQLLQQYPGQNLYKDQQYTIKKKTGLFSSETIMVRLTHTIVPYQRKVKESAADSYQRYAVINGEVLGAGSEGEVIRSRNTLVVMEKDYLIKSKNAKPRVAKVCLQSSEDEILPGEAEKKSMMLMADIFHPKATVGSEIIISREFKGICLHQYIFRDERFKLLSLRDKIDMVENLLKALKTFHDKEILHRDIKALNVIFNPVTKQLQIIDLGFSCKFNQGDGIPCGSPRYMSNEARQGKQTPATDIYALGIICWDIISGGEVPKHLIEDCQRGAETTFLDGNVFPAGIHSDESYQVKVRCITLLKNMLNKDQSKRASIDDCLGRIKLIRQHLSAQSAQESTCESRAVDAARMLG